MIYSMRNPLNHSHLDFPLPGDQSLFLSSPKDTVQARCRAIFANVWFFFLGPNLLELNASNTINPTRSSNHEQLNSLAAPASGRRAVARRLVTWSVNVTLPLSSLLQTKLQEAPIDALCRVFLYTTYLHARYWKLFARYKYSLNNRKSWQNI